MGKVGICAVHGDAERSLVRQERRELLAHLIKKLAGAARPEQGNVHLGCPDHIARPTEREHLDGVGHHSHKLASPPAWGHPARDSAPGRSTSHSPDYRLNTHLPLPNDPLGSTL
jgi:hypothetical protein